MSHLVNLSYSVCSTRHSRDELYLDAVSDCPTLSSQALAYCPRMKHSEPSEKRLKVNDYFLHAQL